VRADEGPDRAHRSGRSRGALRRAVYSLVQATRESRPGRAHRSPRRSRRLWVEERHSPLVLGGAPWPGSLTRSARHRPALDRSSRRPSRANGRGQDRRISQSAMIPSMRTRAGGTTTRRWRARGAAARTRRRAPALEALAVCSPGSRSPRSHARGQSTSDVSSVVPARERKLSRHAVISEITVVHAGRRTSLDIGRGAAHAHRSPEDHRH